MNAQIEKSTIRRDLAAEFSKRHLEDANEAQTRLKIIDRILFELLGWTHDDVTPEERVDKVDNIEFTDYSIRTVNSGLVIEAKRVGSSQFPSLPKRRIRLGALARDHSGLWKIIEKARDYALHQSLQFACVTNGNCWVVFPASRRDSVPWLDSSAIVFDGLETILGSDWAEFVQLLSRDSVISASLELSLLGTETDQVDDRRSKNFTPKTKESKHNSIFELIREGVDIAFSDVTEWDDAEALKYCYVQTPDRQRFDSRIRMAVSRPDGVLRKRQLDAVSAAGFEKSKKLLTSPKTLNSRSLALLVLGSVGAGKTTFLQYFRKVGATDYFSQQSDALSPKWIWIDFRDFASGEDSHVFITEALFNYVLSDLQLTDSAQVVRPAFRLEIEGLKRSLAAFGSPQDQIDTRIVNMLEAEFGNKKSWSEKILRHASTKVPVFIIIDNVDQILDLDKQSEIFNGAMALAGRLNSNVVVSLRESTFVQHRSTAVFNAFEFDSISIEPPPIAAVLSRRFAYLRVLYKGKKGAFEAENGASVNVGNIADVVDLMQRSVLGTEVGNIIEVLAGGDVRLALKISRQFLEVGYTGPGKAYSIYKSTGRYVLPPHEALRSIILGNKPVYDESHSVIANPFDSRMGRSQKQLLRLFVMSGLVSQASNHSFDRTDGIEIAGCYGPSVLAWMFAKSYFLIWLNFDWLEQCHSSRRQSTTVTHRLGCVERSFVI